MELEKHKIVLYTSANEEDIVPEIERFTYASLGAADLYEAYI